MTTAVPTIGGWLSQIGAALQAVPSALERAAPRGEFATVLSSVQRTLEEGGAASAGSATAPTGPTAGGAPGGAAIVAEAEQYLGVPYQWGGATPSGFDCSGLVQYVFARLGVALPRTSQEQATVGTAVPDLAQAQPGDLVFFAGSDGTPASPGHVGIYLGHGEMIDAPHTGAAVRIDPVGHPVAIRRVPLSSSAGGLPTPGTSASGLPATGESPVAPTAAPTSLAPLFASAAGTSGVPADVLVAVAKQESNFRAGAVSSAGAQGLMQLMPQTAAALGVDPMDPTQAIGGAAHLLAGYLQRFGSLPLALAAYNAGPAAVAEYGGIPPFPQTQQYVSNIMASLGAGG